MSSIGACGISPAGTIVSLQKLLATMTKELLAKEMKCYEEAFGVGSHSWNELHLTFNPNMFCPANRKSYIGEYLTLEWMANICRKHNIVYYYGIDVFLEEYKNAVYSCLQNLD